MRFNFYIIFTFLFSLILNVSGEYTTVGPKILYLKSSARITALGGYFTAINNDINAIDENPAGTTFAESLHINLTASKWIGDINHLNTKAIIPINFISLNKLNLLFTSTLLFYPQVPHYDESGSRIGQVRLTEGYTGLGVSSMLFNSLQFGVLFKYIYRDIYQEFYSSLTTDIGLTFPYKFHGTPLFISMALKNIGYDFQNNKLPSQLIFGASRNFYQDSLLLKLDIGTTGLNNSEDIFKETFLSFGGEYNILNIIVFRGGLKYIRREIHPTFGLGTGRKQFKRFNLYWSINYVYTPMFYIEEYNTHQLTLNIMLFTESEKQRRERLFKKYSKEGRLYYLKKKYHKAVEKWEKAIEYKYSSKINKLLEETQCILPARRYKKDKILYYKKKNIIIEEEENEVLFNIVEENISLFEEDENRLSEDGEEILNLLVKLINNENYKRVITIIYSRKKASQSLTDLTLARKKAKKICEYLIKKGIPKNKISYKSSEELKEDIVKNSENENMHKILLIRWKGQDEEKFKYYYFNGLDAYIREGYQKAINYWEKALQINPGHEDVKKRIKQAKKDLKRKK